VALTSDDFPSDAKTRKRLNRLFDLRATPFPSSSAQIWS
jgi:hypothetical protein